MKTAIDFLKSERTRMILSIASGIDTRAQTIEYITALRIEDPERVYNIMRESITAPELEEAKQIINQLNKPL